jgi:hypothetical protein
MNFSLFVINFKFGLSFTLVDLLSELVDLIRAFSSFFGKLIHLLFEVFINFSNFVVEILFLLDQSFKIVLFNKLLINIIFEICERLRFGHFFHQFIHFDGKLFFDALDKLLVTCDIWIILKLSAQYSCGILKLLSYNLNLVFGFLELLLLWNTSELSSPHHKLSIGSLKGFLLVHGFGNLITLLLCGFSTGILLEQIQEVQFIIEVLQYSGDLPAF